jgi:benzoyl-CoA reductase subunit A
MKTYVGVDLGSTTTKAVLLDEAGQVLGRGLTNSRSNYEVAAIVARQEAQVSARFTLLERELARDPSLAAALPEFREALQRHFRFGQHLASLAVLRAAAMREVEAERVAHLRGPLTEKVAGLLDGMEATLRRSVTLGRMAKKTSDFFRDRAASVYSRLAERAGDEQVDFDDLMGIFDKSILQVENTPMSDVFDAAMREAVERALDELPAMSRERAKAALDRAAALELQEVGVIGTGYGRQTLPFAKDAIRSEILCHGLGAHSQFPGTRTVLDIGGQDTKAIQVDEQGVVTGFQMNDRCAAGCGRYLGYIADEMSLGVHELGPLAMESTRHVKITSTCTVFAGAELRDRLSNGERREDILNGLHRAIILRAMALLARSGGVAEQLTFTGGVANNVAAVKALRQLVEESYGQRTLNISPGSIYTGALGAALFCRRAAREGEGAREAA